MDNDTKQLEYLNDCMIKKRVIHNVFEFSSFVTNEMDFNEDIATFTQQCSLRLYIICQMCSAVEIKTKEKHQCHGEVIEEPLSPFVQKHMHISQQPFSQFSVLIPSSINLNLKDLLIAEQKRQFHSFLVQSSKMGQIEISGDTTDTNKWSSSEKHIIPFEVDYSLDKPSREETTIQIPTRKVAQPTKTKKPLNQGIDYPCSLFLSKCYSQPLPSKRRSSVLTTQKQFVYSPPLSPPIPNTIHSFIQRLFAGQVEEELDPILDDWSIPSDPIEEETVIGDDELIRLVLEEESVDLLNYIEESRKREAMPTLEKPCNLSKRIKSIQVGKETIDKLQSCLTISTEAITEQIQTQLNKQIQFSTQDIVNVCSQKPLIPRNEEKRFHSIVNWILICLVHSYNVEDHPIVYKMRAQNHTVFVTPSGKCSNNTISI